MTVNTYLDGFRGNDHAQILSCLTDDIEWTVFGAILFIDPPELQVMCMVGQGDVVMAEPTGTAKRVAIARVILDVRDVPTVAALDR